MTTPEARLKADIRRYLESEGAYWCNIAEGAFAKPGDPDIVACVRGRFVAIEAKSAVGRQSAVQKERQAQIEEAGGTYILARDLEEVKDLFRARVPRGAESPGGTLATCVLRIPSRRPGPLTRAERKGGEMKEGTRFKSTRKVVRFGGGSTYVCLDRSWGIKPGDMVTIEVEKVDDGTDLIDASQSDGR